MPEKPSSASCAVGTSRAIESMKMGMIEPIAKGGGGETPPAHAYTEAERHKNTEALQYNPGTRELPPTKTSGGVGLVFEKRKRARPGCFRPTGSNTRSNAEKNPPMTGAPM